MLDFNDVAIFIQVVQSGSFAEAARRLGMPPNTVSRRVEELETRLDARLLARSTRKLNLTVTGRAYYDACAQGIADILGASEEVQDAAAEPSGLIRVAAPAAFFEFFRIEWVAEFLARHPKVRIDFLLADRQVDLIEESIDGALLQAARAGLGVALLPLPAVERDLSERRLVRVLPEYRAEQAGGYLVTPTRRHRSAAAMRWIDFVADRIAQVVRASAH